MTRQANHIAQSDFEKIYTRLLELEKNIYTDEELANLPEIAESHPHFKEWQVRKESSQNLLSYLEKRKDLKNILEIGCGNGWLSHWLSNLSGSNVVGIDLNFLSIRQAATVFRYVPNLHFIHSHEAEEIFETTKFDCIIFADSVQYFPSLTLAINKALTLCKPQGEIHILNSPLYSLSGLKAAKERSLLYFEAIGLPEMANWYFHHTLDELDLFNHSILYDPENLFNRFLKNKNPYHWIHINQ